MLIFAFSYMHKIVGLFTGFDENGLPLISASAMENMRFLQELGTPITFVAFGGACVMILVKDKIAKLVAYILLGALAYFLSNNKTTGEAFLLMFAVFLPTLIHVFLFTGAFILFGCLLYTSDAADE